MVLYFPTEYFVVSKRVCTFTASEPAKPLHNAQIGGSFFYMVSMKANFDKPYGHWIEE